MIQRLIALGLLVLITTHVQAQLLGIPIANDASPKEKDAMYLSGGAVFGDEINIYGAQLLYYVHPNLALSAAAGAVEPENGKSGLGLQGSAQYAFPQKASSKYNLSLRFSVGYADYEQVMLGTDVEIEHMTVMAGGMISRPVQENLTLYAFLGAAYQKIDGETGVFGFNVSLSDTDPVAGIGALFQMTDTVDIYAEAYYIDNAWVSVGLRHNFSRSKPGVPYRTPTPEVVPKPPPVPEQVDEPELDVDVDVEDSDQGEPEQSDSDEEDDATADEEIEG